MQFFGHVTLEKYICNWILLFLVNSVFITNALIQWIHFLANIYDHILIRCISLWCYLKSFVATSFMNYGSTEWFGSTLRISTWSCSRPSSSVLQPLRIAQLIQNSFNPKYLGKYYFLRDLERYFLFTLPSITVLKYSLWKKCPLGAFFMFM